MEPHQLAGRSRLRAYAQKLESQMDVTSTLGNALALAPSCMFTKPTVDGSLVQVKRGDYVPSDALADIELLKAEIAGVETVLSYLKSPDSVSVHGKPQHRPPSQAQLKARSTLVLRSLNDLPLQQAGVNHHLVDQQDHPDQLVDLTLVRPGLRPAKVQGAQPRCHRRQSRGRGGAPGAGGEGAAVAWKGVPRGLLPVGRGEAVILESALDQALPQGAISAKYAVGAGGNTGEAAAAGGGGHKPSATQAFLASQDIQLDYELLEGVLREAARQVAASCGERGRLLVKIGERYREVFGVLIAHVNAQHHTNSRLLASLAALRGDNAKLQATVEALKGTVERQLVEIHSCEEHINSLAVQAEHSSWDAEQAIAQLTGQNEVLAAQVEAQVVAREAERAAQDEAMRTGLAQLESQVASVGDERDDLTQRIRFLEKQIIALKHQLHKVTPTRSSWVQTDPFDMPRQEQPEDAMDVPVELGLTTSTVAHSSRLTSRRRKAKRMLGGFEGLIKTDRPGRVRGVIWTTNAVAQLYYDKTLHDVVCDRESNPRTKLCEFAYEWHLTKYGLVGLAEASLMDLIASVRHHQKSRAALRWFALFSGLLDLGEGLDSPQHLSFYLFTMQQLAYPASLTALFPGEGEEAARVRVNGVVLPDVCKAVFRYLNQPESCAAFMAQCVDPLLVTDSEGNSHAPLAPLIRAFMSEYSSRVPRNTAHLKALFNAVDTDEDGLISYDQLVAMLHLAAPSVTERLVTKLYSEAMRLLPPGVYLMSQDIFVAVARQFGLDRWRVDPANPGPLPGFGPGGTGLGQLLAAGPGVLGLMQATRPGGGAWGGPFAAAQPGGVGGVLGGQQQQQQSLTGVGAKGDAARRGEPNPELRMWKLLEQTLVTLDPDVDELLAALTTRLGPASPTLQHLQRQASSLTALLAAHRPAKGARGPRTTAGPQGLHRVSATAVSTAAAKAPPGTLSAVAPPPPASQGQTLAQYGFTTFHTASTAAQRASGVAAATAAAAVPACPATQAWLTLHLLLAGLLAGLSCPPGPAAAAEAAAAAASGAVAPGLSALAGLGPGNPVVVGSQLQLPQHHQLRPGSNGLGFGLGAGGGAGERGSGAGSGPLQAMGSAAAASMPSEGAGSLFAGRQLPGIDAGPRGRGALGVDAVGQPEVERDKPRGVARPPDGLFPGTQAGPVARGDVSPQRAQLQGQHEERGHLQLRARLLPQQAPGPGQPQPLVQAAQRQTGVRLPQVPAAAGAGTTALGVELSLADMTASVGAAV
ncbi:hypothetical protein V8C86DRAFT_3026666 [Haematococcus lacustris]